MSFAYHSFSEYCLKNGVQWPFGFIAADLMTEDYIPDPSVKYRGQIPGTVRPRPKVQVQGRGVVDGAADCFDIVFPRVPNVGIHYIGVALFIDTALPTTDLMLVYLDSGPEWPILPNGGNVVVQADRGVDRLFRIGEQPCPAP